MSRGEEIGDTGRTGCAPRTGPAGAPGLFASFLARAALLAATGCPQAPQEVELEIQAAVRVARVDERFLSVAVDAAHLVGGAFWDPAGGGGLEGGTPIAAYDFSRPVLRKLAAELSPAYLRLGGTDADRIAYDLRDTPVVPPPPPYRWVLTRTQWDAANAFASQVGFRLMFTLNAGPGPRDRDGRWQPDQARALIAYSAARGHPVELWELGNEINAYPLLHRLALTPEQYAEDLRQARELLKELQPASRLAGPAIAFWPVKGEFGAALGGVLRNGGDALDVVTWHYYPQQSRRCPAASRRAGLPVLLDPDHLDEVGYWAAYVESRRDRDAPQAEIWLGETGNAQCGGEPGVSDRFAASLWWVDQLGLMARRGQKVTVRHTLSGAIYGLVDDATLRPNPDYWASVLWKRLMGPAVLAVERVSGSDLVRAYAACARSGRPGAVSVALVNLSAAPISVRLVGVAPGPGELYALTAGQLDAREVSLNRRRLTTGDDGSLPDLTPLRLEDAGFALGGWSYAFAGLPEAQAPACR